MLHWVILYALILLLLHTLQEANITVSVDQGFDVLRLIRWTCNSGYYRTELHCQSSRCIKLLLIVTLHLSDLQPHAFALLWLEEARPE